MKLNKLYIKNFKNIIEIEIDDFKRINVIIGENGNGKSSVLESIGFLFTNSLDEKLEEYIRWGQDKFNIEAEFTHNGVTYQYEVEVGKGTKRRLVVDGKDEFLNSEATKYLADIIDPQLAAYSAISEQGKTTQLLFQKPSERLKTIKQILKYDSIFDAVENLKEDAKKNQSEIDKIDTELNVLNARTYQLLPIDDLKKQIEEDVNIESLIEEQNKQKVLFDENRKKKETYDNQLKSYNEKVEKKSKFEASIAEFKKELENKKVDETFNDYDDTELKSLIALKEDQTIAKVNYDNQIKSYNDAQSNITTVDKTIVSLNEELSAIIIERLPVCKYNNDSIKETQSKINSIDVNITKLKDQLELIKKGKCPTCGKDFVEDPKQIEESILTLLKERKVIIDEKDIITSTIEEHKKKVEDQRDNQIKKKSIQDKISFYENEKIKYSSIVKPEEFDQHIFDILIKQIEEQQKIKSEYEVKKQEYLKRLNEVNSIKDKISFYENEIKSIGDIVEPEKVDIADIFFDENYFESLKKRLAVKEQKVKEYERAVEFNEKLQKEQKDDKKKIDTNEKRKENLLKDLNILSETRTILEKDFPSYCIDKSIGFIRDGMNDFFQKAYNKYSVTVKQDKNSISFFYSDGDGIESPCTMASGAEKNILAIANRIALMKIQDLNIFILDEVDAELSCDNSINLFTQLFNQDNIEQFFLITHREETKEYLESLNDCEIFEIKDGELV